MMTKDEAITIQADPKYWNHFPVFVWREGKELVTDVDGYVLRSETCFGIDTKLDEIGAPMPRNIYFIDAPAYEDVLHEASPETKDFCNTECMCVNCFSGQGECLNPVRPRY